MCVCVCVCEIRAAGPLRLRGGSPAGAAGCGPCRFRWRSWRRAPPGGALRRRSGAGWREQRRQWRAGRVRCGAGGGAEGFTVRWRGPLGTQAGSSGARLLRPDGNEPRRLAGKAESEALTAARSGTVSGPAPRPPGQPPRPLRPGRVFGAFCARCNLCSRSSG